VQLTAGTLDLYSNNVAGDHDSGTYKEPAGTTMAFDGNRTLGPTTTLSGTGTVELDGGTLTVDPSLSLPNLTIDGGSWTSTANLTVTGTLGLNGGSLVGAGRATV